MISYRSSMFGSDKVLIWSWLCLCLCQISADFPTQTNQTKPMITAQITLKSASGASLLDKDALVTSETVSRYQPSPETVRKAKKLLQSEGFEVAAGGIGLSATTSVENFEKVFGVKLSESKVKHLTVYKTDEKIQVPAHWKEVIESVDLPEPVEYH